MAFLKVDPTKDTTPAATPEAAHQTGTEFVANWMAHPETKKRYQQNMAEFPGLNPSEDTLEQSVGRVNTVTPTFDKYYGDGERGRYRANNNSVTYYGDPTVGTAAHEATHASKMDKPLSNYLMNKYGVIKSLRNKHDGIGYQDALKKEFNPNGSFALEDRMKHTRYLSSNGELYPRIMEMRQMLGVVPGQVIDDAMIEKIYANPATSDTARYYTPEQLKEMLNTVASQNSSNRYTPTTNGIQAPTTRVARRGGILYK